MTVSFGSNMQRLADLQNAVNPQFEISNWLDLLRDPDAVSALVRTGNPRLLAQGARQVETDLFADPWQQAGGARASTVYGGNTGAFSPTPIPDPQTGVEMSETDALANLRRLQLGIDPGRTAQLRNSFLASPEAQGATEALGRRQAGGQYNNRFGLSHYRNFDSGTQRRLTGEASAFGRSRQDFSRDILGNTPGGRGGAQRTVGSAYRRV